MTAGEAFGLPWYHRDRVKVSDGLFELSLLRTLREAHSSRPPTAEMRGISCPDDIVVIDTTREPISRTPARHIERMNLTGRQEY